MNKRITSFAVCFLLMSFVFTLFAQADVLIAPNNSFYKAHQKDCIYLNRSYNTNSPAGYVSFKTEPGSVVETSAVKNGTAVLIIFTYDYNGVTWGVTNNNSFSSSKLDGWVPMDQLLLNYDYISFAEDHQSEIYTYTGGCDALRAVDKVILWSWPGSGKEAGYLNKEQITDDFKISTAYKDGQGREWGYFSYWYGNRNCWICLSDPASDSPTALVPTNTAVSNPTNNTVTSNTTGKKSNPTKSSSSAPDPTGNSTTALGSTDGSAFVSNPTESSRAAAGPLTTQPVIYLPKDPPVNLLSLPVLIIALILVLMIGTAILIRVFWKPKKKQTDPAQNDDV